MVQQFNETGGTKAEHVVFATVRGKPVLKSSPVTITRAEAEDHLRELESNPLTFDLEMMVDMANDATKFLSQMQWKVLLSPLGSNFVTSDCPVFRMFTDESDPDEAFLRPDCHVICPLTKSALLVMEHDVDFLKSMVFGGRSGGLKVSQPHNLRRFQTKMCGLIIAQSWEIPICGALPVQSRTGFLT